MQLEKIIKRYRELGIENQIDYSKFYLYSLITHSTAIEGSTITELENQIMFDDGVSLAGKSIEEQNMNLDLKVAYEKSFDIIKNNKFIDSPVSAVFVSSTDGVEIKENQFVNCCYEHRTEELPGSNKNIELQNCGNTVVENNYEK